jgi:hypothetical protein
VVHINTDSENPHAAVSTVPLTAGVVNHVYIYVRTYDGLNSQSYDLAIYRQPG